MEGIKVRFANVNKIRMSTAPSAASKFFDLLARGVILFDFTRNLVLFNLVKISTEAFIKSIRSSAFVGSFYDVK